MSAKSLRCAVYTRKSSEEGLEQDFNSLHAQREACMAYVSSQAGEGWTVLPKLYDDGGFSGGNTERPALQALLLDIAAGHVDVVVVYKIDRLTRSLNDFAKIVDVFDKHGVSIVSVTQPFNTTTSMGRLTLNMLLSFAQFEREVTSERIRDKIAASKKRGLWMGGVVPLGYDADGRTLKVNEAEATLVRHIFTRYLEIGSVHVLANRLAQEGVRLKLRAKRDGSMAGGGPIGRGSLFILLTNRLYLGEIVHKAEAYPGQHKAVVDRDIFDAVQAKLAEHRRWDGTRAKAVMPYALSGKLFEHDGRPITPVSTTNRHGKKYRYYSTSGGRWLGVHAGKPIRRLCASRLEGAIFEALKRLADINDGLRPALLRAELADGLVTMEIDVEAVLARGEDATTRLDMVKRRLEFGERVWIERDRLKICAKLKLVPRGGLTGVHGRPELARGPRRVLIGALRKGRSIAAKAKLLAEASGRPSPDAITDPYERQLVRLAFLAPAIQAAILEGRHDSSLTLDRLVEISELPTWQAQMASLEFSSSTGPPMSGAESRSLT